MDENQKLPTHCLGLGIDNQ